MTVVLLILLLLCIGLLAMVLVAVNRKPQQVAVSPETLLATENRLTAQVTQQLAALEMKDSERAKAQREELSGTLRTRFEEHALLLDKHLLEVRSKMDALGKMDLSFQQLSAGVTRFNTLLANVKARGTWGEVQLEKLLEDLFAFGQYHRNIRPNPRSNKIVEFALALPGQEEGKTVWLPIDSKFPIEDYERLLNAHDEHEAEQARKALVERIKLFATQVKEYILVPHTTDFAILFLPTDGLYLEATRDASVIDDMRRKHILLAGPQSLAALLNALQMGFKTLEVQKNAAKVWDLLTKTKQQIEKFLTYCDKIDSKLEEAHKAVDEARGRVNILDRQLRTVSVPEDSEESNHA